MNIKKLKFQKRIKDQTSDKSTWTWKCSVCKKELGYKDNHNFALQCTHGFQGRNKERELIICVECGAKKECQNCQDKAQIIAYQREIIAKQQKDMNEYKNQVDLEKLELNKQIKLLRFELEKRNKIFQNRKNI